MGLTTAELAALPIFSACAPEDLRHVAEAVSGSRLVAQGEVVCAEGDKADRWWVVEDGLADVTTEGLYVGAIGPGETVGELALLDGEPRAATVTAVTDMRLVEIDGASFHEALLASPQLAVALLRELAVRLRARNLRPAVSQAHGAEAPQQSAEVRTSAARPTVLDPRDHGFRADPAAYLASLREAAPVHWSEPLSSFVVTRYEDVHRLLRDPRLVGSVTTMDVADTRRTPGTRPRAGHRQMIRHDGDSHLRLRRLVSKVFTPRALISWQARAESIVERLLDSADERTELDVIADYALPLPAQVISEMLGIPNEDTPQLRSWSRTLTLGLEPFSTPAEEEAFDQAGRGITDYLRAIIADKRAHPADDILSALLSAEVDGDALSDKDVLEQVVLLYIAGHETTLNLIGNGVMHALSSPDQLARLRADPALDANAVEEVLRFESPAQLTRRVTLEAVDVGDATIPAGAHLTLSLASANRDPRKWGPTADVLDLARPGANEHVSFGGGPHYCLGSSLARLEGTIALPRLLRRFPRMAAADEEPTWVNRMTLRGLETLPVALRG
ncbi:MAG TPA: cytochrome P450 [Mycobacteriales bacterium]|nr:cytochrome P450 [Mycobacteriales bacterium]